MTGAHRHRFGDFVLDPANRSLTKGGVAVALNARYFDALALLVRERGRLVAKQQFFDVVWTGSVVTDAALTQCIKEIRRQLGDDASEPRFVRTVPGHGYRFVAPVTDESERVALPRAQEPPTPARPDAVAVPLSQARPSAPRWLFDGTAAALGGAAAGLIGGALYGSLLAVATPADGLGSLSVLLVMVALSMLVGLAGALGVGFGLAWGCAVDRRRDARSPGWMLAGASLGGFAVGGLFNLLSTDAMRLLVGNAPAGITGSLEGAAIGFAVAAGLWLGGGPETADVRRPVLYAAATTGLAGAVLALAGGRLMATSLASMAATFDGSRLDLAPLGRWFGQPELGALAQALLGALEGAVFGACVVAAWVWAHRRLGARH